MKAYSQVSMYGIATFIKVDLPVVLSLTDKTRASALTHAT